MVPQFVATYNNEIINNFSGRYITDLPEFDCFLVLFLNLHMSVTSRVLSVLIQFWAITHLNIFFLSQKANILFRLTFGKQRFIPTRIIFSIIFFACTKHGKTTLHLQNQLTYISTNKSLSLGIPMSLVRAKHSFNVLAYNRIGFCIAYSSL